MTPESNKTAELLKRLSDVASATTRFSFFIQHNLGGLWRVNFTHHRLYNKVKEELPFTKNIDEALQQGIFFIERHNT